MPKLIIVGATIIPCLRLRSTNSIRKLHKCSLKPQGTPGFGGERGTQESVRKPFRCSINSQGTLNNKVKHRILCRHRSQLGTCTYSSEQCIKSSEHGVRARNMVLRARNMVLSARNMHVGIESVQYTYVPSSEQLVPSQLGTQCLELGTCMQI